jgi:DNA-binding winged helix-turn-helix (wHTH) protein/tetratricopeptide (TPR) repeat protein
MNGYSKRYYEFDVFRLDPVERTFFRMGEPVPLTPKVFDVLVLLVENNQHTITKTEFLDRVWAGSSVEENSLNRNISLLRRALGSNNNGGYIRTVPKTGYRFEAEVRCIVEDEEELVVEKRTNYSLSFRTAVSKRGTFTKRKPFLVASGVILMIAAATAGFAFWNQYEAAKVRKAEALDLYQRGRELWQNRSAAGLHDATLLLEQSIERDPENALARSALADAYAFDGRNWKKVKQVAADAIRIDATLGNPYASIGFVQLFWQWNPAKAEEGFKKAIELSPNYATAHQWYGIMLASVGHFNEGLTEMERALELEPTSVAINADMCQMLYFVSRNFEAEAQCKRTLELDPNSYNAYSCLYAIYAIQGREREAVEAFFARERSAVNSSSLPADFEHYRAAFDRGGLKEFWREHIRLRRRFDTPCGVGIAWIHANLGEDREALECLKTAMENREFGMLNIYADPVLRRLNGDPEYSDIANKIMRSELSRTEKDE